jgi:hypothetical protein
MRYPQPLRIEEKGRKKGSGKFLRCLDVLRL